MSRSQESLSKPQVEQYKEAFNVMDIHDKGYLKCEKLRDTLKIIGYNPTDRLLENLSIEVDSNGDGKIVLSEFIELINRLESQERHAKEAREAFNAFDFMGDGYVAANDVKEALLHVMEKAPEYEKEDIIKHYKLQQNRKILFDEFKNMFVGINRSPQL